MFPNVVAFVCILAIAISILLAYRYKLNTGILAISFAYIIGCGLMGFKVSEVIALFPVKIFFMLFSVCLFYGYAIDNGTMKVISDKIIYAFRNHVKALPFVFYFLAYLLGTMGASAPAITAFMAPLCLAMASEMGLSYFIVLIVVLHGASGGSCAPWGQTGIMIRGLIENSVYEAQATSIVLHIYVAYFITGLLSVLIVYFLFKGYKIKAITIKEPGSMDRKQKQTLIILGITLMLVLVPSILNSLIKNDTLKYIGSRLDIQMLSIVGAAIFAAWKMGDEKKIILKYVPWNTIVMVCGICVLVGLTEKTGFLDNVAKGIGNVSNGNIVALLFVVLCGFMSLFAGAMTVVMPTIIPLALKVAVDCNINPAFLVTAVVLGACFTASSPFSTSGSFILSCLQNEEEKAKVLGIQVVVALLLWTVPMLLAYFGVYAIV